MRYNPFRNLGLKVVALALASLLWLTVSGEHTVERSLRVPLEFRNIPAQLELVGDPPSTVDVRLRGSSGLLSRLEPGEVVAVLDLVGARVGSRLFHLRSDQVKTPFGVEVAQVQPPTLALELERSATRVVPVVPAVEGDPAAGYVIGKSVVQPPTVHVAGPESRLRQLTEATTEPVSIAGASAPVRDVVTIGVADAALRLREAQRAEVTVEILPSPVERAVAGIPVRARGLAPGLSADISPPTVTVRVRGSRQAITALSAGSVQAFVDLAGLGTGRYNLPIEAEPPADIGIVLIEPAIVQVRLR